MAQEITHGLVREAESLRAVEKSGVSGIVELLVEQLAQEVVRQLEEESSAAEISDNLEDRLDRLETQVQALVAGDSDSDEEEQDDDDEDEAEGAASSLPNLKYAKPKYKGIDSVLKYIERDDDDGGIKLVIMNFND